MVITLHEFLFASLDEVTLLMGSTLKGKNLLLEEQILSFKNQHTNEKGSGGGGGGGGGGET